VGAVDVGVQRGEFVVERVADETLRRQVIAFVRRHLGHQLVDAGEAFERCGMQHDPVAHRAQPDQPVLRILQGYAPDGAMHLIAFRKQKLREIRSILPGNSGNQRASTHKVLTCVTALRLSSKQRGQKPNSPL
jgi:hypothetical protein